MNKHLHDFYSLKCSNEILDIVKPVMNLDKEITEAMSIVKLIRKIVIKSKKQFVIYDFCAGNALASVISCFLFKNVSCYAIDKAERQREWGKINNFRYINKDINWDWDGFIKQMVSDEVIIIGVHACKDLSKRIIEIYNNSGADHLILMPCCTGQLKNYNLPEIIKTKIGNYLRWCLYLLSKINGKVNMIIDNNCLSPKNAILTSKKIS